MNLYFVIPCYNEEIRFAFTKFRSLILSNQEVTFIFVDDGSTDKTKEMLKKFIKDLVNAKLISSTKNLGKANAIRLGFQYIENSIKESELKSSFFAWTDADDQISFEDIQQMIKVCIKTTRKPHSLIYFATRNKMENHDFLRRIGSNVISRVLRSDNVIGMPSDTQCGLKAFQVSEVFAKSMIDRFETRWFIEWELLIRFYESHKKDAQMLPIIVELPLSKISRSIDSHISFRSYVSILKEVLYIRKKLKYL